MAWCRRMLKRGPAFRARSYGWSAQVIAAAAEGDTASEVVVASRLQPAASLGVTVYRPMGTRFFVTRIDRLDMHFFFMFAWGLFHHQSNPPFDLELNLSNRRTPINRKTC